MLVHTVLFWLRQDLNDNQLNEFRHALEAIKGIRHAEAIYIGTPSKTPERPAIDTGYDFCLTVLLKDLAAHNAYQADPIHIEFLKNKDLWKKIRIYDAD